MLGDVDLLTTRILLLVNIANSKCLSCIFVYVIVTHRPFQLAATLVGNRLLNQKQTNKCTWFHYYLILYTGYYLLCTLSQLPVSGPTCVAIILLFGIFSYRFQYKINMCCCKMFSIKMWQPKIVNVLQQWIIPSIQYIIEYFHKVFEEKVAS